MRSACQCPHCTARAATDEFDIVLERALLPQREANDVAAAHPPCPTPGASLLVILTDTSVHIRAHKYLGRCYKNKKNSMP